MVNCIAYSRCAEYDSIRVKLPNVTTIRRSAPTSITGSSTSGCSPRSFGLEIMVNEHHQTATNVNPSAAVVMARWAGDPLGAPSHPRQPYRQPARAGASGRGDGDGDVYSRGRLECGFVRGVPYEMSAGNHRPTHMMERFWEAHDLIVKAWTSHDGPFNWEGKYFHHRQVNIWPRPYQEPHPRSGSPR